MINLKDNVSEESRVALGLPDQISRANLYSRINWLKSMPDNYFPKGKWATIQHLESLVIAETILEQT